MATVIYRDGHLLEMARVGVNLNDEYYINDGSQVATSKREDYFLKKTQHYSIIHNEKEYNVLDFIKLLLKQKFNVLYDNILNFYPSEFIIISPLDSYDEELLKYFDIKKIEYKKGTCIHAIASVSGLSKQYVANSFSNLSTTYISIIKKMLKYDMLEGYIACGNNYYKVTIKPSIKVYLVKLNFAGINM